MSKVLDQGNLLLRRYIRDLHGTLTGDFPAATVKRVYDRGLGPGLTLSEDDTQLILVLAFAHFEVYVHVLTVDVEFNTACAIKQIGSGRIFRLNYGDVLCSVATKPVTNKRKQSTFEVVGSVSDPEVYQRITGFISARIVGV